ncbi:MAG: hypothetical protein ACI4RD_03700 [Kiritimatiellia bacterium]
MEEPDWCNTTIAATRELKDLASRLGVAFLDHLVIGSGEGDGFVALVEVGV